MSGVCTKPQVINIMDVEDIAVTNYIKITWFIIQSVSFPTTCRTWHTIKQQQITEGKRNILRITQLTWLVSDHI